MNEPPIQGAGNPSTVLWTNNGWMTIVCLDNIHFTCDNSQCECCCHQIPPIQPGATTAALAVEAMKGTKS